MKIGLIGNSLTVDKIHSTIKNDYPDVELIDLKYDVYTESIQLIKACQESLDGLLFSGRAPLKLAEKNVSATIPWEYVPKDCSSIYRALLEVSYSNYNIAKVSFDSFCEEDIYAYYEDLGIEKKSLEVFFAKQTYISDINYIDYLVNFHKDNFCKNNCHCCVTDLKVVYNKLRDQNIPCVNLSVTSDAVLQSFEKLHSKCMSAKNNSNQIVVVFLEMDFPNEYSIARGDEFLYIHNKMKIAEKVYLFGERISAAIVENGNKGYLMFTSKEIIETETDNFKDIYLLDLINEVSIKNISIGIGYGQTAKDAKYNATCAVEKAKKSGENVAYVVYEAAEVKGPIKYNKQKDEDVVIDKDFMKVSDVTGISTSTLYKIYSIVLRNKKTNYTSRDLASLCNMSRRNMDRILQKLENCGFCDIVGERMLSGTGRPSRIIKFNFF